jgi:hypothetical protein
VNEFTRSNTLAWCLQVLKKILELSDVLHSGAAASIPPESAVNTQLQNP